LFFFVRLITALCMCWSIEALCAHVKFPRTIMAGP
jgi:hypothetical protein